MNTYDVIESKVWQHDDGRRVSIYGAVPWQGPAQRERWNMVTVGWTVREQRTGQVGIGRKPWATEQDARQWVQSRDCGACRMTYNGSEAPLVTKVCGQHNTV